MELKMNKNISIKLIGILLLLAIFILIFFQNNDHRGNYMNNDSLKKAWLGDLFRKSKLTCFGRYAMEIPSEAEIIVGGAWFPDDIEMVAGGFVDMSMKISRKMERIARESDSAEVKYSGIGPVSDSWQIRYFSDKYTKKRNLMLFNTFIAKGEFTFIIGDAVSSGESEALVIDRQARLSEKLRLLASSEIPTDPGFCLEKAFIAEANYGHQEMIAVGIHFPEYPDVTFSLSSNKDAYADLSQSDFQKARRDGLPLLARIKQAKEIQGDNYPSRTVLREGKRTVQHWQGEESLFRREDGTHDFEWAFVGNPKDVANPSEYRIKMFTKVAYNTVGAADKASLTDEQAVALWDRLLAGLKFRVKVPGAPEGSYYFLPGAKTDARAKP
ncbi:T6SS immunity protein Tli4 family protein [Pseudoduganella lutea]|uniref:T6SS immunity protein Tli4 family protein n=1 Tax=Pseudoduganella lutea TaxID=321985 RepID=UPI001E36F15F|nr:T6SS immunity protein Tli4 family protein [Pseudoduganella lutea]